MTHIAHKFTRSGGADGRCVSSRASMCFCVTHNAHRPKGHFYAALQHKFGQGVGWGWGVEGREARDCDWHLSQTIFYFLQN